MSHIHRLQESFDLRVENRRLTKRCNMLGWIIVLLVVLFTTRAVIDLISTRECSVATGGEP